MVELRIVIPTKNEEKYLGLLLDSIRSQTYVNYEIIVSDANSTDKTKKIAKSHGCKVIKGGYLDIGRNNGAIGCKAPIICFIDSDVVLPDSNYLVRALKEFKEKDLDLAGSIFKSLPSREKKAFYNFIYAFFFEIINTGIILSRNSKTPFMQSLIFMKRGVHGKVGGFPPYEFGEDSAFSKMAVAKGYKFGVLNESGKAFISPRRLEKEGIFKMISKSIYFNGMRILGHEFVRGETKSKYWD
jgi:glycosyltransferase involved in cell wall biosynthesis